MHDDCTEVIDLCITEWELLMASMEENMKKSPAEEIESKFWSMFDIIRGKVDMSESYILLLYLSLYKDDLLSKIYTLINTDLAPKLAQRFANEYADKLPENKRELSKSYDSIIQGFFHYYEDIDEPEIFEIVEKLEEIDRKILSEYFPEVFDSILYKIVQSQGRNSGEFIQPVELTRLICSFYEMPENSSVFNPFAGLASFGVFLDQSHNYFGQEINRKTWALGALRLMAYSRPGVSNYVCDDSILHWPENKKFDLILANPPFRVPLKQQDQIQNPGIKTYEQFLIEKGISSLKNNGKLIAVLPTGILFKGGTDLRLRERLIEYDLIDTIISFPGGVLQNTGIPIVILVLDKAKKLPGQVRIIDAKRFIKSNGIRGKVINDYPINSLVKTEKESDFLKIVSNDQIRENKYNLNVAKYFQIEVEGVSLSDILEVFKGNRIDLPQKGRLIRIRDLKDDKLDFKLDIYRIELAELNKGYIHRIDESCLMIAKRWKNLKPTYFEFKGDPIFCSDDIFSFKINKSIANLGYVINELHADYVKKQLDSIRLGDTIPYIQAKDFLNIKIQLPTLREQAAKVQGINEIFDYFKQIIKINFKNLNEFKYDKFYLNDFNLDYNWNYKKLNSDILLNYFNEIKSSVRSSEFESLKHTLGRPRQNILDWSDNLLNFLLSKEKELQAINQEYTEFYEIDIIATIREIKRDINFVTEVLEKGENGFILEEFSRTLITLFEINSIIDELSDHALRFKINKLLIKGEKLKDRGIIGHKTLLKTLLDNLVTNANKYGFENKEPGNELVIELTEIEDNLVLEVKNNGKPFPRNYDKEKFITKYSTGDKDAGSGIGGYDINRIAEYFNNPEWELILSEDLLYPVKFKFIFPIKLIM